MTAVSFHSADRSLQLAGRTELKRFIQLLFKKEGKPLAALVYVFCSDERLLQMNRDFLQHDFYTDIITFGLSENGYPIEAEVYISLDRVRENARNLSISYKDEMLRVIFHGALHLCGYKDKRKSEIALMRSKEEQYLRLFVKKMLNA